MYTWGIQLIRIGFITLSICAFFMPVSSWVHAADIITYRDTISDSAPNSVSNHTIEFKTKVAIDPGGYVRFTPTGGFSIPATSTAFGIKNVELFVNSGGGYTARTLATTSSATEDGVSITSGTSGNVEITLNSSTGIPANSNIRMLVGTHTSNASSTDTAIVNPATTTSYKMLFGIGSGTTTEEVEGWVAIVDSVYVGPVDTTETVPPVRFNGSPTGTISGTTLNVQMSLETDEFSRCRYSTASNTPYFSMSNEFTTSFAVVHATVVAVATSTSYTFYIRCIDDEGNQNTDDYVISFDVPEYPEGTPGNTGDTEGTGSGTGDGDGESSPGDGNPDGNGEGDDEPASGGGGGGGGSGGGSGGSSGGSDGGGGFEGTDKPYQSGDGRVIIKGYAFPGSEVVALVDGVEAESDIAGNTGSFEITVDEIASGAYTFGVYAIDDNNVKSSTFATTFTVTGSRGSTLSNVNIMPSILVNPDPVDPGASLTISGYAMPEATVTIENEKDTSSVSRKTFTTTSDNDGVWSIPVDTSSFSNGTYKVRAKSKSNSTLGISTDWSGYTYYGVGESAQLPQTSDLNQDGKVNLIDFSILLFWWNSDGGNSNPSADINQDGTVSLTDFSIMIFNWTG